MTEIFDQNTESHAGELTVSGLDTGTEHTAGIAADSECEKSDSGFVEYRKTIVFSSFNRYEVEVIFTDDIRQVFFSLNCGGILTRHCGAVTVRALTGQKTYIILPLDAGVQTFCHEAYHAVNSMFHTLEILVFDGIKRSPLERQGVSRPERDQELWAYTLGFLANEIAKFAAECGLW
jgi:hypothetical protein